MRKALVLEGSESQLMSLWPVSGIGTKDLMAVYYRESKMGVGRSAGLRKVKLELLRSEKKRHPYDWASFIQSGEWVNLQEKRSYIN
jgi:CHAT domain-containing protein